MASEQEQLHQEISEALRSYRQGLRDAVRALRRKQWEEKNDLNYEHHKQMEALSERHIQEVRELKRNWGR